MWLDDMVVKVQMEVSSVCLGEMVVDLKMEVKMVVGEMLSDDKVIEVEMVVGQVWLDEMVVDLALEVNMMVISVLKPYQMAVSHLMERRRRWKGRMWRTTILDR